jgi:hypothetical protein
MLKTHELRGCANRRGAAQSVIQYSGPLSKTPQDFLNFVNFRHVHISYGAAGSLALI